MPDAAADAVTYGGDVNDWNIAGTLAVQAAAERPDLMAEPVAGALDSVKAPVGIAEIDPDLADTAAFCEAYQVDLAASANCVVVAGKRGGEERYAACVVLATTRADVNGVVRRYLDVRKASFAPTEDAVARTGMEYGGITPIGLPEGWPILVDARVIGSEYVVIGSGVRHSKIVIPGAALADLPGAVVRDDLARPIG